MIRKLGSADAVSIDLSAREVVDRSNIDIQVDGPYDELVEAAGALFRE